MKLRRYFNYLFVVVVLIVLTIATFWLWAADKYVVPVLMYHRVEDVSPPPNDTVTPDSFARQMAYLHDHGYHVLSMDEYIGRKKHGEDFSRQSVVLTFDDGFTNNYTEAFPVLQHYALPATFFVSPGLVGDDGFMSWNQLRQMQAAGLTIGSHGMEQLYLPDLSAEDQANEIFESRRVLEEQLNTEIVYYAYPIGGFSEVIKASLQQAGYKAALATNRGHDRFNDDLFEINRIKITDDNLGLGFWVKLSGYYNLFRKLKAPH